MAAPQSTRSSQYRDRQRKKLARAEAIERALRWIARHSKDGASSAVANAALVSEDAP